MRRIVHFVYGLQPQREPFPLVHFLAVESARRMLRPDRIFFHVHELPFGEYWDRISPRVELVPVEPVTAVDERQADPLVRRYLYAHHADVVRLDALLEHGGLYLDIDTLTIAAFPDHWWSAPFVIGRETIDVPLGDGRAGRALLNAVMLAQPGAPFARVWREQIIEAMDGSWSAHSCDLAARLADAMPDEVTVLPEEAFSRFGPTPTDLQALLMPSSTRADRSLASSYVLHLCQHLWWERQRTDFVPWLAGPDTDERYIRDGLSVYARCARPFLIGTAPAASSGPRPDGRAYYVGHDGPSGYGVAAHRAVRAMRGAGHDVDWQALHGGPSASGWWHWWVGEPVKSIELGDGRIDGPCEVLIGHSPPDHVRYYRDRYQCERFVSNTVWETDRIPPSWPAILNGSEGPVDAVVVPTEWNARMFREGGVETPIHVVPHVAVPDEVCAGDTALDLDLNDDDVVFYMLSVWSPRKSIDLAVNAFIKAFTDSDPVALVIKSGAQVQVPLDRPTPPPGAPENFAWWHLMRALRDVRNPPRIVLATDEWSDGRIAALHRRGDCYFALPHSEGWGLGAFDASTVAKPVITTGWGGPLAYLGDDYHGLVSGRLATTTTLGLDRGAEWFDPDLDHAVELLRAMAEDRGVRRRTDREALAARISRDCSATRVASLMAAACGLARARPSSSLAP
ncbi:MAG: glycosyltransferase [Acidimicrobiia bacterium]|nr:glycosyltransferase [Acidimicrobiia bacterium]